jgi:hypothetical protein
MQFAHARGAAGQSYIDGRRSGHESFHISQVNVKRFGLAAQSFQGLKG